WSVRPSRNGTRIIVRLAISVALRIASGTSRALPWPKPTRPFWSPTTTSAAKPKRRPPLTTLATRLMWTSLSTISLSRSSRMLMSTGVLTRSSEVEAALARGVGERLHSPVIDVSATVKDHVGDSGLLGPFRNQLPDLARGGLVGAPSELLAHLRLKRRSGG